MARHHLTRQNNRLIIFLHLVTAGLRRHPPSLWLHPTFAAAIKNPKPAESKVEMLTCDGVRLGHKSWQTSTDGVTIPVGCAGGAGATGAGVTRVTNGALDLGTRVRH